MATYKVWIQTERIDDDDSVDPVSMGEPIALRTEDSYPLAERFMLRLAAMFELSDMTSGELDRLHDLEGGRASLADEIEERLGLGRRR